MEVRRTMISAMKVSISEVLEKMFFLPIEFSNADRFETWWVWGTEDLLVARLNFRGPTEGSYFLFIPEEIASVLAANFMGLEESDITGGQRAETAKEIVNMIAGSTFGHWDSGVVFDLGIPEITSLSEAETYRARSKERVFIGIRTLESHLGVELMKDS